ncbi:RNA-directed DNA polymerase, eukaryota, reverse transcriptase zinc-binding domain protein [Tanacetum coccineum]
MQRYYKDRKELVDATENMDSADDTKLEDVIEELNMTENSILRNVVEGNERRKLWNDLGAQKHIALGVSWVIMEDFNVTLSVNEHSNGSACSSNEMVEFRDCILEIEMEHMHSSGFYFTWTKSLKNPQCKTL